MKIKNPIARITAAIILIFSLLAVVGVIGEVDDTGGKLLSLMIGSSLTFLFVAQTKAVPDLG